MPLLNNFFKSVILLFIFPLVQAQEIDVFDMPLLGTKPEGSRVFRRKIDPDFAYTELTLLNGVQIILKTTKFDENRVLFAGYSAGGSSIYLDEDYMSASMATEIVTASGLAEFDKPALDIKLAQQAVSLTPYIFDIYEGITGYSSTEDLETLLQLNYLYFTNTRRDEIAFNNFIEQLKNSSESMMKIPFYTYLDSLNKIRTSNAPRSVIFPSMKQIERIKLDNALYIFNDRFADAGDFKFFLVGNFNINAVTPLLEKYLGGLPTKKRIETWRDVSPAFPKGINTFTLKQNHPDKCNLNIAMEGDFNWNVKEMIYFEIFTEILKNKLRKNISVEQSDALYINVLGNLIRYPKSRYSLDIECVCSPEKAEDMKNMIFAEAKKIKDNGPDEADLNLIKEYLIRQREANMANNEYWMSAFLNLYQNGEKIMSLNDYKKAVNSVKTSDVKKVARQYFNETNYLVGFFMPPAY